ncbi:glycosyltransferase [Porticoccaceae bacterium]|nr:glycosyltransferase [Porticoccaceae bacterium]
MEELHSLLAMNIDDFEILLIDRAKNTSNADAFKSLLKSKSCFRHLKLAFSVSDDVAMYAGLENAIGDYVIIFDPSQNDLQLIPTLLDEGLREKEIVIGVVEKNTNSFLKNIMNRVFEGFFSPRGIAMANFMCLSRNALNAVTKSGRLKETLWNKLNKVGLDIYEIPCLKLAMNASNFRISVKEKYNRFLYNSLMPFRIVFSMVLISAPILVILAFTGLALELLIWTALVVFMIGSALFMIITFEFTNKLLLDKNEHFDYLVADETCSDSMVNKKRLNVELAG